MERLLLRSVWGSLTSGQGARAAVVRDDPIFIQAWAKLGGVLPAISESHAWCFAQECKPWGISEIYPNEIIGIAEGWRAKVPDQSRHEFARYLFLALMGLEKAGRSEWERTFRLVVMDDHGTTFAQLCARPGGATLTPEWHAVFAQLASRTRHETWTDVVVGNDSLHGIFTRFAKPAFNPTWVDALNVLHPALPTGKWDEFFTADKEPCPTELVDRILSVLRVRDASDEF